MKTRRILLLSLTSCALAALPACGSPDDEPAAARERPQPTAAAPESAEKPAPRPAAPAPAPAPAIQPVVALLVDGQVAAAPDPAALEALGSATLDYLGSCLSAGDEASGDAAWSSASGAPACVQLDLDPPARLRAAGRSIEVTELLLPLGDPGLEGLALVRGNDSQPLLFTDGDEDLIRLLKVRVAELLGPVAATPGPPEPAPSAAEPPTDAEDDADQPVPDGEEDEAPPPGADEGQGDPADDPRGS